ncbi:aspartate kinase [Stutzerimonas xanthomarina]|nr:aspartate kinase [Stutzerimonas xanthomarina]
MKRHERQAAHSVEKIGGTSMSNYAAVRDNIILRPRNGSLYQRVFVVSAYGGVTDQLLEDKKNGRPGVYALFAGAPNERNWREALLDLRCHFERINAGLFKEPQQLVSANTFIGERLLDAEDRLGDLDRLCRHANFERQDHLDTVREMLASLGEAHSAWNMTQLLRGEGLAARFVDLTAWHDRTRLDLDERIRCAFAGFNLSKELPIVTGYAHSREGLMRTFARGYSEMTFSRIAVITGASEAIIHKEYHLSSADPRLVGEQRTVPIGRTNYDVADQLANLGMEAIHPKAARGLRQQGIPLRVMNSFQPEHPGTLITSDYVSECPRVEIIAGRKSILALECFDQEMMDCVTKYDRVIDDIIEHFKGTVVTKDTNANTITHFLANNIETVERIRSAIGEQYSTCDIQVRRVAVVSAIGSNMDVPGILSHSLTALARSGIEVLAVHQPMRQVDIQFVVDESDYESTVVTLHRILMENSEYRHAVCAA